MTQGEWNQRPGGVYCNQANPQIYPVKAVVHFSRRHAGAVAFIMPPGWSESGGPSGPFNFFRSQRPVSTVRPVSLQGQIRKGGCGHEVADMN